MPRVSRAEPAIVLVRHAEADRHALAQYQPVYAGARFDFAPLTLRGVRQAHRLSRSLQGAGIRLVLSSPYTRALQTAAILAARLGCPLRVDLRLHDWLPIRDGAVPVTAATVAAKVAEYQRWVQTGRLPSERTWETLEEMRARVTRAVLDHRRCAPLVVVSHAAPIQAVLGPVRVPPASWHQLPLSALAG